MDQVEMHRQIERREEARLVMSTMQKKIRRKQIENESKNSWQLVKIFSTISVEEGQSRNLERKPYVLVRRYEIDKYGKNKFISWLWSSAIKPIGLNAG